MASIDATPNPRRNIAYRVTFPIFDSDGDPVPSGSGLDSEVSLDQAAFSDCASEAVYITGSVGMYYLDLSAAEMNANTVALQIKIATTDAKTTMMVLYPDSGSITTLDSLNTGIQNSITNVQSAVTTVQSSINTLQSTVNNVTVPFYAKIDLTIDSDNTRDEYTVGWYSGGSVLTTGVTSPTINVISRDGTTLIGVTGMSAIGNTHVFSYNESTNRVTAGDAVIVTAQGTIGGSTRTWRNLLARDS